MCSYDNDIYATVLSEFTRKANKEHKCGECHRSIKVGERYKIENVLFDGTVEVYKTCQHCLRVRSWLLRECGSFFYGGLREDIYDHICQTKDIGVKMMYIGMKRKWLRKDGKMWKLPSIRLKNPGIMFK